MLSVKPFLRKHKTGSLLLLLLLVSLILMAVTSSQVKFNPQKAGFAVVSIFQRGVAGVGGFFGRIFTSIGQLKRLKQNYQALQEQLQQYNNNARDLVQLQQENQRLREALGFGQSLKIKHIAAEVIGRDPDNLFNAVVINKGSVNGIHEDMPVVSYQSGLEGLVGKTVQVGPVSTLVLPLYDSSCYVPGRLESSRYTGLVNGDGRPLGGLTMTTVPKSAREQLAVGDLVVTSGLSSIYPPNIYIGRISRIGAKSWETSLRLDLEPIIDFSRLEYVFVLDLGK